MSGLVRRCLAQVVARARAAWHAAVEVHTAVHHAGLGERIGEIAEAKKALLEVPKVLVEIAP